jgi:hypothetical protein
MRQIGPILAALALVGAVIGGFIYHRNLYKIEVIQTMNSTVSADPAAIKGASDTAALYVVKLKKTGQVPVKADTLSKNPEQLFNASE